MDKSLNGIKVAVLAVDGFEQAELVEPQRALADAGATVHVISEKPGTIQGFKHVDKGDSIEVDTTFDPRKPRRVCPGTRLCNSSASNALITAG